MTEQQPVSKDQTIEKSLAEVLARLEPVNDGDFKPFLRYLQQQVTVEQFLAERLAQANTDVILSNYSYGKSEARAFPVVVIDTPKREHWGPGRRWEHKTFMLSDDKSHIYFFSEGWPMPQNGEIPYLRPEDIIPFEDYSWDKFPKHKGMAPDRAFTKPLERAPISGGEIELFNYRNGRWEVNDEGIAQPSIISNGSAFHKFFG